MTLIQLELSCDVPASFAVRKVCGMFDIPPSARSTVSIQADVPAMDEDWSIGCIVGPSGSGKSSIARKAFGDHLYTGAEWPALASVVDSFDGHQVADITRALSSVGFNSPPSWLRPYHVLSNGERFRCDLARALLCGTGEESGVIAFDEFTSVVDRTVAKAASVAVSKAVRSERIKRRFVAVTCHYDIVEWLEPDWVVDMATGQTTRRRLRRPEFTLEVFRCGGQAWQLFKPHHYLSADLNRVSQCFLGTIEGIPAVFVAFTRFFGRRRGNRKAMRVHRIVTLPDYQGIGVGHAILNHLCAAYSAMGFDCLISTSHPAEIHSRAKSPQWRMNRAPNFSPRNVNRLEGGAIIAAATDRRIASFQYVGPALTKLEALKLIGR